MMISLSLTSHREREREMFAGAGAYAYALPAPLSTSNIPRIKVWACFQVLSDKRAASRVPFLVRVRERARRGVCWHYHACLLAALLYYLSLSISLQRKFTPKILKGERERVCGMCGCSIAADRAQHDDYCSRSRCMPAVMV